MGTCINIFGIPVLEDKDCANARRNKRNDRKAIEEASDVAKNESDNERREENVSSRNTQQALSSFARNADGVTPLEGTLTGVAESYAGLAGAVAPGLLGLATGGVSTALSGLGGLLGVTDAEETVTSTLTDPNTLLYLGLAAAGVYLVATSK